MTQEEGKFLDKDVFLNETLLETEDELILQDIEQRQSLASCISALLSPMPTSTAQKTSQLEIDYVIGESSKQLLPNWTGPAAIIIIFGVTKEGHSVCGHVHGFEPYFYINCPLEMGHDDIPRFRQHLEAKMGEANRNSGAPMFIRRIELVYKRILIPFSRFLFLCQRWWPAVAVKENEEDEVKERRKKNKKKEKKR